MKTIMIIIAWFVFIGTLATLVSCGTTQHCDAYGQTKQVENRTVSK